MEQFQSNRLRLDQSSAARWRRVVLKPRIQKRQAWCAPMEPISEEIVIVDLSKSAPSSSVQQFHDTVVLHDVPDDYTEETLMDLLDLEGFVGRYDYVCIFEDTQLQAGRVSAVVKFQTEGDADFAFAHFQDFDD